MYLDQVRALKQAISHVIWSPLTQSPLMGLVCSFFRGRWHRLLWSLAPSPPFPGTRAWGENSSSTIWPTGASCSVSIFVASNHGFDFSANKKIDYSVY